MLDRPLRRLPTHKLGITALFVSILLAVAASAQDDVDDVLGGFDDDVDPGFEAEEASDADGDERFWELSGSAEISGSINYLSHRSATGTRYSGLQRLRKRLNLELDVELDRMFEAAAAEVPAFFEDRKYFEDWKLRVSGWGFYDSAYAINGRDNYTRAVRRSYELDGEVGETWLQGKLHERLDFKIGRQVVIWGRSESLRVLDVLNPIDNREPGRVDLEDLRRPVGMARFDAYFGDWSVRAIIIPEIRFDRLPVLGSDFFPGASSPMERKPSDFAHPEYAVAVTGVFSGWDISLHGAYFWNDTPRLRSGFTFTHDRLWLVGAGGNYTIGSLLIKSELAYIDGFRFFHGSPVPLTTDAASRLDSSFGLEYYGFTDVSLVAEVVNRYLFDFEETFRLAPNFTRRDTQQIALRATQNFLNDTLHATAVVILFALDASDGSVLRLDLKYDVRDAIAIEGGILLYQSGDLPPFDGWADNDRIYFGAKWSF